MAINYANAGFDYKKCNNWQENSKVTYERLCSSDARFPRYCARYKLNYIINLIIFIIKRFPDYNRDTISPISSLAVSFILGHANFICRSLWRRRRRQIKVKLTTDSQSLPTFDHIRRCILKHQVSTDLNE